MPTGVLIFQRKFPEHRFQDCYTEMKWGARIAFRMVSKR